MIYKDIFLRDYRLWDNILKPLNNLMNLLLLLIILSFKSLASEHIDIKIIPKKNLLSWISQLNFSAHPTPRQLHTLQKSQILIQEALKKRSDLNLKDQKILNSYYSKKYKTKKMDIDYRYQTYGFYKGEQYKKNVQYFSIKQTNDAKAYVKNGRVVNKNGHNLNVKGAKYTMDQIGNIIIYEKHIDGVINHSSFIRAKPAASAGYIDIEDGIIKRINLHSGHYKPTSAHFKQMIEELLYRQADLSKVPRTGLMKHLLEEI